jgi:hypothetical protein
MRSPSESDMILRYRNRVGGTLIEEYMAVCRGPDHGHRWIDAVIIKTEETRCLGSHHQVPLDGKDVIVVQCKTGRLGMHLMGKAYFSMYLIERHGPAPSVGRAVRGAGCGARPHLRIPSELRGRCPGR